MFMQFCTFGYTHKNVHSFKNIYFLWILYICNILFSYVLLLDVFNLFSNLLGFIHMVLFLKYIYIVLNNFYFKKQYNNTSWVF